ncbi:PepSY-associated TM helix domain-containing protein [Fodinibius saliphilus]|uniref:PepSY-associated TM helix domain-containing protein n=1 Tax=Fodinibius saliphilus TaxID=1920650 RepID=UPI001108D671|nr:PepSY-associated TM helix domain-containing protein [Fodinibius saliphilus]
MFNLGKRPIKKIAGKIHLWLGLPTGLVVFIVAITGSIYCFQEEISALYDDYKYVEAQEQAFIPPSRVHDIAGEIHPGKHVHSVIYGDKTEALEVVFYEAEPEFYQLAYINPYSGDVIKVMDMHNEFFHIILDGHIYLWMGEIGKKIVSYSTLIFLVILISGLILWWPRNKKIARKKTRFSWSDRTRWKRKNYDLHNILGFYASAVAVIVAITGLVMAFNWFAEGVHTMAGGEKQVEFVLPENESTKGDAIKAEQPIDVVWQQMNREYPNAEIIEMHYPPTEDYTIYAYVNFSKGTYYNSDFRYFDRRTLEEIKTEQVYSKLEKASFADMVLRMNYDIHVGAIGGIVGKIIVFLSSLIVGSLPITGFMIWWGRHKKVTQQKRPGGKQKQKEERELVSAV